MSYCAKAIFERENSKLGNIGQFDVMSKKGSNGSHNLKVVGSNPTPAIELNLNDTTSVELAVRILCLGRSCCDVR